MLTLSIDMATPEGELLFQALAQAQRYLAATRDAALASSARAMLDSARTRWMEEDAFSAFLASVPSAGGDDFLNQLEAEGEAARIANIPLDAGQRGALRRRLEEEARVLAYRWMMWTFYGIAQVEASNPDDAVSGAARASLDAVQELGIDLREEMREAHRRMFKVLMQNRKAFRGGSAGVVKDAAAEVFAEYCPSLATQMSKAFDQVMWEADCAIYDFYGKLCAAACWRHHRRFETPQGAHDGQGQPRH